MTKRLVLMRHAKSEWDDPLMADIDRPLNDRGRKSASALGKWLTQKGYVPDSALSSSAQRTRETFDRLGLKTPVMFLPELYLAPPAIMMRCIQHSFEDTILLLGHNPGIAALAEDLIVNPPQHDRFFDFPTGATLVCDFATNDWAEVVSHSGQVVDFIVPKDLIG